MPKTEELFEAIRAGDLARVRALVGAEPALAAARDAQGVPAVLQACYRHRFDLAEELAGRGPELDLCTAAALGRLGRMREILDTEPEAARSWAGDGFTPLHLAAFFGHPGAVRLLLERGADPDAEARNPSRVRPIHSAAVSRRLGPLEVILEHGCDVNARQHGGFTALHSAAHGGLEEMVIALRRRGADPGIPDDRGRDAAALARDGGHDDLARRLAVD